MKIKGSDKSEEKYEPLWLPISKFFAELLKFDTYQIERDQIKRISNLESKYYKKLYGYKSGNFLFLTLDKGIIEEDVTVEFLTATREVLGTASFVSQNYTTKEAVFVLDNPSIDVKQIWFINIL